MTEGVTTNLIIENGNDASTHRMCARFATDLGSTVIYKEIAAGTGRKLVGKKRVAGPAVSEVAARGTGGCGSAANV